MNQTERRRHPSAPRPLPLRSGRAGHRYPRPGRRWYPRHRL